MLQSPLHEESVPVRELWNTPTTRAESQKNDKEWSWKKKQSRLLRCPKTKCWFRVEGRFWGQEEVWTTSTAQSPSSQAVEGAWREAETRTKTGNETGKQLGLRFHVYLQPKLTESKSFNVSSRTSNTQKNKHVGTEPAPRCVTSPRQPAFWFTSVFNGLLLHQHNRFNARLISGHEFRLKLTNLNFCFRIQKGKKKSEKKSKV